MSLALGVWFYDESNLSTSATIPAPVSFALTVRIRVVGKPWWISDCRCGHSTNVHWTYITLSGIKRLCEVQCCQCQEFVGDSLVWPGLLGAIP